MKVIKQPPLSDWARIGKSLSDDSTYAAALQRQPCVAPGFPSRECSTQNPVALEDPELAETEPISATSSGGFVVLFTALTKKQ